MKCLGRKTITNESIITSLLTSSTIEEASKKLGIEARTIYKRMKTDDFQRLYNDAKSGLLKETTADLQAKTGEAVQVIASVMNDASVNPNTRIYGATAILQYATKYTELLNILERIEALEKERETWKK